MNQVRSSFYTIALMDKHPASREAVRLLKRVLTERGVATEDRSAGKAELLLQVQSGLGVDGYQIDDDQGAVRITGNDPRGLLYGVGRFLHTSSFGPRGFLPSSWRGVSVPNTSFRGLYMAHNFHNWYRSAPLNEITSYIEELALWGLNAIVVPAGTNPHSPAEEIHTTMIPRQIEILRFVRRLGISVGLIATNVLDHEPELVAKGVSVPDADPPRRGNVGHRVCMTQPIGVRSMSEQLERNLDMYADVGLDFVVAFPYDEGGCGCPGCYPWGAKGYVTFCKLFSQLARAKFPGCRFIAGTWCFDVRKESDGEYSGFDAALHAEPGWCDRVMTDAHDSFPEWPLRHGSPGGLPMVNFPEISMWGRYLWGGSGANPYPRRLVEIWRRACHLLDGCLPYSEGRFEDLNKVTGQRLFWNKEWDSETIVRDYAAYEFGIAVQSEVAEAVRLLEENYPGEVPDAGKAGRALALLQNAEKKMTDRDRAGFRWRLLMLRAIIDVEMTKPPSVVTARRNAAYEALIELYSASNAQDAVCPRAKSAYDRGQHRDPMPIFE